jgi:transcriptional regulator with XRE-family HTH domain
MIDAYLKGENAVSVDNLDRIAEALSTTPSKLLSGEKIDLPAPKIEETISPELLQQITKLVLKESSTLGLSEVRRGIIDSIATSRLNDVELEALFKPIRKLLSGRFPGRNKNEGAS